MFMLVFYTSVVFFGFYLFVSNINDWNWDLDNSETEVLYFKVGLGAFLVERSFFPENERNDQERPHRSEKKTNA